jgi:transposase-like protein
LANDIHVTQKTAWYILHKVRTLFEQNDTENNLHGTVECDEMYLGGRETNKHECKKTEKTQGRSTKTKTPIFGMAMVWKEQVVGKNGKMTVKTHSRVNAMKVSDARAFTLIPIIEQFVAEGSTIVTDELSAYNSINADKYEHRIVRHGAKEFSIGGFSTNGIEGFWGHFKRMVFGTYHFVSKAYLDRYIDEAVFRFNTKEMSESSRFAHMFRKSIGKCDYKAVKMAA